MISKFKILATRSLGTDLVRTIVIPTDEKIWPELRKNLIDFRVSPIDKVRPHRGTVYVAFVGNYFGPGRDNVLTVSMWRQFK